MPRHFAFGEAAAERPAARQASPPQGEGRAHLSRLDASPAYRNNPAASDQVLGGMRSADIDLVHDAVRSAAEAWPKWRNTAAPGRGKVLLEVARLMDKHREELARLRRENERLRMERDFLKKATAFFAKESR